MLPNPSPALKKIGSPADAAPMLVVDDLPEVREIMKSVLQAYGFLVLTAEDGLQAVSLWEAFSPSVVWMDNHMPVLDGIRATGRIRFLEQSRTLPRTPIVAFSSDPMEPAFMQTAGFDAVLQKPFKLQELGNLIRQFSETAETALPQEG